VMGDSVVLQLRQFGLVSAEDLADTWFEIAELGFIGPKFLGAKSDAEQGFCDYNEPCVENADCQGTSLAVDAARDAVAHMQWISGAFIYMCSGGLIADTDPDSQIPYFLSANHCISKARAARNLECFFQYTASCGTTDCPSVFELRSTYPQDLRTLGASIKATNRTGDYTLFELSQGAPDGSAFLGWSSADVANSDGTELFRISHPGGAPQAYSEHTVDTSAGTCSSWPRGSWIYSRDTYGATEGGSSGSPVVNSAGQVVGQLSGACGFNVNDVCDNVSNATVDGAFASYFGEIQQFLNPAPCSPEVCDDGSDNDCDGLVDCSDPDCDGDPACEICGSHGDSCVDGTDCCSGKCKRGTCRGN